MVQSNQAKLVVRCSLRPNVRRIQCLQQQLNACRKQAEMGAGSVWLGVSTYAADSQDCRLLGLLRLAD
jgi:hypothetical protein